MEVASLFIVQTVALWFIFGRFFDCKEYNHFRERKKRKVGHDHSESISPIEPGKYDAKEDPIDEQGD